MSQGVQKEAHTSGGGGASGEFGEDLPGLRGIDENIHLVQVYGTGSDGGGQQLDGGSRQHEKGQEELDADDEDPGPGRGRPEDVRDIF